MSATISMINLWKNVGWFDAFFTKWFDVLAIFHGCCLSNGIDIFTDRPSIYWTICKPNTAASTLNKKVLKMDGVGWEIRCSAFYAQANYQKIQQHQWSITLLITKPHYYCPIHSIQRIKIAIG